MKQKLDDYIRSSLKSPIEEEISAILEIFEPVHLAKGQAFKEADTICRYMGFVVEGAVKHCMNNNNEEELVGMISDKNNLIADMTSTRTNKPTPIAIQAIEPTTLLVADMKHVEALFETNLTFNRLVREFMSDSVVNLVKLYILFINGKAKERYRYVIESNPELLKKVPLRVIASMIGVTPTQLSRIRKDLKEGIS